MPRLRVVAIAVLALAAPALGGEAYRFTVNQTASSLTYQFNTGVPFTGTLIGTNDPLALPAAQTRTKRMTSQFSCGTFGATQNDAITISGSITASGASPTPPTTRPGGTLIVGFDTTANTAFARNLNLQFLATGALTVSASLSNFNYQSFCTVNPSCNAPFFFTPPPIPLGSVSVTSLSVVQQAGDAVGTLTSTGPDAWDVSIPMTVTVTPTATFGGSPLALDAQVIPIVFTGNVARSGGGANLTSTLALNFAPPANPTPTPLPPTPFTVPADSLLCPNINITLNLTVTSPAVTLNNTAALVAPGTRLACPCDVNTSGGITVQDVFDFLTWWFASDPRADFNGVAGVTIQDVFDFLTCWFNPPREC